MLHTRHLTDAEIDCGPVLDGSCSNAGKGDTMIL